MKLTYKAKILLSMMLMIWFVFATAFGFYFIKFRKTVYNDAIQMVDTNVGKSANQISAEFNTDMGLCRAIAYQIASSQKYHTESRWKEHISYLKEADKQSKGYLNIWASFELSAFQKGHSLPYGRRVLNIYSDQGEQHVNDYLQNLDGDDIGSSYLKIKTSKKEAVIEPYLYSLSGKSDEEQLVTSICVPIMLDNSFIGLAGVDIGLERYQQLTDNVKPYPESYSFLVANDGTIVTYPQEEMVNRKIKDILPSEELNLLEKIRSGKIFSFTTSSKTPEYLSFAPIIIGNSETPWALVTATPEKIIYAKAKKIIRQTLLMGLIGIFILGCVIWIIVSRLTNTINKFITFSNKVNNGILTETISINSDDEIGQLATSLMDMATSLRNIVNQIKLSSRNISEASDLLNKNSQNISLSASRQAAEMEEISSALEQMLVFIKQNAEHSKKTENIALISKDSIIEGSNASLKASKSMQEIASKNHIVSDIAFQTNILALNAAVEAARAGDQGKGFSVVAAEVKKLAERSKEAAAEINKLSQIVVSDSNKAQDQLFQTVPKIEETTDLVQKIAASSKEQSDGVGQINLSIHQLNDITQDNAASAESMAASAEELSAQADQLEELISSFKS